MIRRVAAPGLAWLLATTLLLVAASAAAQLEPGAGGSEDGAGGSEQGAGGGSEPGAAPSLLIDATPVFGPSSLRSGGWGEVLVRIRNAGKDNASGEVVIASSSGMWGGGSRNLSRASFAVGSGAAVHLRVPTCVGDYEEPSLEVLDATGKRIFEQTLPRPMDMTAVLVDVSRASALGAALRDALVGARVYPLGAQGRYAPSPGGGITATVASPRYDELTGEPIMPLHGAAYAQVAAVLMHSDDLGRLEAAEREALTTYLLGGGTLALVIERPEDLRDPTLKAWVGGPVSRIEVQPVSLRALELPQHPPGGSTSAGSESFRALRPPRQPSDEVRAALAGYSGGNLRASLYGSSAPYGLGEVHLLAFDPTRKPGVDARWVQGRMIDVLRRALERRSSVVFPPGGYRILSPEIRRQLDPNEGSRWAIVIAALLLCLYAVVAGPVNFAAFRKRGRPLRALIYLPVLSGLTCLGIVAIGLAAKGCTGRSRHLTVAEAGAGMEVGIARRWRGFYTPSATKLSISNTRLTSVLATERTEPGEEPGDLLVVDRDGARLADRALRPWEALVVREDGLVDLGGGIGLVRDASGKVEVHNRTGRTLRGLLLFDASRHAGFLAELADGDSASSTSFVPATGAAVSHVTAAGMRVHSIELYSVATQLSGASEGLDEAWSAVLDTAGFDTDWLPPGVPVLLAQIDGGEGRSHDSGLVVDRDRLLVRVVGYGDRP